MLARTDVTDYPQFVKWCLWEVATNLLAYADRFDPRRPPSAAHVASDIANWQTALERIRGLATDYGEANIGEGEVTLPRNVNKEARQLDEIIEGLRTCWQAHHMQRALEDIIRERRGSVGQTA